MHPVGRPRQETTIELHPGVLAKRFQIEEAAKSLEVARLERPHAVASEGGDLVGGLAPARGFAGKELTHQRKNGGRKQSGISRFRANQRGPQWRVESPVIQ